MQQMQSEQSAGAEDRLITQDTVPLPSLWKARYNQPGAARRAVEKPCGFPRLQNPEHRRVHATLAGAAASNERVLNPTPACPCACSGSTTRSLGAATGARGRRHRPSRNPPAPPARAQCAAPPSVIHQVIIVTPWTCCRRCRRTCGRPWRSAPCIRRGPCSRTPWRRRCTPAGKRACTAPRARSAASRGARVKATAANTHTLAHTWAAAQARG